MWHFLDGRNRFEIELNDDGAEEIDEVRASFLRLKKSQFEKGQLRLSDPMTAAEWRTRTDDELVEARISAALADLEAMDAFVSEVGRLIGERAFHTLPEFKRGRERLEGFRHLTSGPWRGVFLVSRDGADVAVIVFSRHPHVMEDRLPELFEPYRKIDAGNPEDPQAAEVR